jgi:hypothetical protein
VSNGRLLVFEVQFDQFDSQANGIDAADLSHHAVGYAWTAAEIFGEVKQAIHTSGAVIEHEQQRTRTVFRPQEHESLALSERIVIDGAWQAKAFRSRIRVLSVSPRGASKRC